MRCINLIGNLFNYLNSIKFSNLLFCWYLRYSIYSKIFKLLIFLFNFCMFCIFFQENFHINMHPTVYHTRHEFTTYI